MAFAITQQLLAAVHERCEGSDFVVGQVKPGGPAGCPRIVRDLEDGGNDLGGVFPHLAGDGFEAQVGADSDRQDVAVVVPLLFPAAFPRHVGERGALMRIIDPV